MSNAFVSVRVRPPNSKERKLSHIPPCIRSIDHRSLLFKDEKEGEFCFHFDRCFYQDSSQADIFEYLALPVVRDAMDGINGTILTYGQTGAGKTYSLEGPTVLSSDQNQKGVLPRVAESVFGFIEAKEANFEFTIKLSMVEIYMERIRDLLDPSKDNLQVKENKANGIFISGATEICIRNIESMLKHLSKGIANRVIGETLMNSGSSRSHCAFLITIQQKKSEDGSMKTGKLYLVDLAGSEKVEKTGAEGKILDEAKMINKSLSALGNVINALTSEKPSHIPYRDSKLTRILQESLGGNSKIVLLCCCSPSAFNASESLSTLRFGTRAKQMKNTPKINTERGQNDLEYLIGKYAQECEELRGQVLILNTRLQCFEKGEMPQSLTGSMYNERLQKLKQSVAEGAPAIEEVIDTVNNILLEVLSEESDDVFLQDEMPDTKEVVERSIIVFQRSFEELSEEMKMLKDENKALKTELRASGYLGLSPSDFIKHEANIRPRNIATESSQKNREIQSLEEVGKRASKSGFLMNIGNFFFRFILPPKGL